MSARDPQDDGVHVHFLDVGAEEYGDAVLCRLRGKSILIDGAHPGDDRGSRGHDSIPDQLGEFLGQPPESIRVDLLVVTHAHQDHIGCLPTLVRTGVLKADWALVADPRLGWGRPAHDAPHPQRTHPDDRVNRLVSGLREEPLSPETDAATLESFLSDAANLESRYVAMLTALRAAGTEVVRWTGEAPQALLEAFEDVGLRIVGPREEQLELCRQEITDATDAVFETVADMLSTDVALDESTVYRRLMTGGLDALDAAKRPGPAINLQSIVTSFDVDGTKLLFAGDMQFANPQVGGDAMRSEVSRLRELIEDAGPFDVVKLSHHGSDNAFDARTLRELGGTKLFGICAGEKSKVHPHARVLTLLGEQRPRVKWVRTDRNRQSTISLGAGAPHIKTDAGRISDPRPNTRDVGVPAPLEPGLAETPAVQAPVTVEDVEVLTRIPNRRTTVRVTVEVDPGAVTRTDAVAATARDQGPIGGGRSLPKLLFVTSRDGLIANLGAAETERLLDAFEAQSLLLYDELPRPPLDSGRAQALVHEQLKRHPEVEGVVIVGGYDVVPSRIVDALPERLRRELGETDDPDDFLVFSDWGYGDLDGGERPDVPVSRIPDGRSPELVFAALGASDATRGISKRGIRNVARPFADAIFEVIPGEEPVWVSQPTTFDQPEPEIVLDGDRVYVMLHGDFFDSSRFWGEGTRGNREAVGLKNIPSPGGRVVFTGCCWGALTVDQPAVRAVEGAVPAQKLPSASIAMTFLRNGATAFVGCTGAHYSPIDEPYDYFGGPMHRAFWQKLGEFAPAKALFEARIEYVRGFPHGRDTALQQAIEFKILNQYTCLGLGW